VDCKKCNFNYCPCCETKCPECGEVDIPDNPEIMLILQEMRELKRMRSNILAWKTKNSHEWKSFVGVALLVHP